MLDKRSVNLKRVFGNEISFQSFKKNQTEKLFDKSEINSDDFEKMYNVGVAFGELGKYEEEISWIRYRFRNHLLLERD